MKSAFLLLWGWLLYTSVFAQEELFRTFKVCRQSDTVHLNLPIRDIRSIRVGLFQEFFTGVFFKRVDESVLKLPTQSYKDRFLKCENCEITNYSVDILNSGRLYLKGLDLLVEPTEKTIFLTTTSQSGDTLSRLTVLLSPKMTFYLKINDKMVKIDPSIPMPDFRPEDKLYIVARAENGEKMKVVDHSIISTNTMWCGRETQIGDEIPDWSKAGLANSRRNCMLYVTFSDEMGNNEWRTKMQFFKWE